MSLQKDIKSGIMTAMKEKDSDRLTVLRSLVTLITNELVAKKKTPQDEMSDEDVLGLIRRSVKQHKDSIEQFRNANRNDLVEPEERELIILEKYLPQLMSQDEIRPIATAKKAEMGIDDKSKMGQLMGAVMGELKGKADGGDVKAVVESLLE